MKSLDGGNYKLFTIEKAREGRTKPGGVQPTPRKKQEFSRRALFSQSYDDSNVVDPDDAVDNQVGILEASSRQMKNFFARTIDRVALDSLISTVQESNDSEADSANLNLITASVDLNKRYRGNAFAKIEGVAANAAIATLDADTLEDIGYIFGKRDVEGKICCTLTNELRRILRKDPDFKSAENRYSTDQSGAPLIGADIPYKSIWFVDVSDSVLPILGDHNIGNSAAGSRAKTQTVAVRDLETAENVDPVFSTSVIDSKAKLKTALGTATAKTGAVSVRSTDMIYFWSPDALYFTQREQLTFARLSELDEQSYAKQLYMRSNFGAMLIDDDFGLTVPLKGTVTTALGA